MFWSCSLHADDIAHNVSEATPVLTRAADLGCRALRTDLSWKDLEPARGIHDAGHIAFYRAYFAAACSSGLAPFPVLSQAPQWAKELYSSNSSAFFAEAENYATQVMQLVSPCGTLPLRVQLWNELNHVPSRWVRRDACALLSALGRGVRHVSTTAQLWVNAMADDPLWKRDVDGWIQDGCAGAYIDGVGIDHYPGTWTLSRWGDWTPLTTLLDATEGGVGAWRNRKAGVLETGFSSWSSVLASEMDQAAWVNVSLPALRAHAARAASFELANWYELLDGTHTGTVPQEAHFGVMRAGTLERKPAFLPLAQEMKKA